MKLLSILVLALSCLASYGETQKTERNPAETRSKAVIQEEKALLLEQLGRMLQEADKFLAEETPAAMKDERDAVKKERESIANVIEKKGAFSSNSSLLNQLSRVSSALSNFRTAQLSLEQTAARGSGPCQYCDDPEGSSLAASSAELNDQTAVSNIPVTAKVEEVQPGTNTGTRKQ